MIAFSSSSFSLSLSSLVSLAALTKYHKLGAHSSGIWKSKIKAQHGQVLVRALFLTHILLPSRCVFIRQRESSGVSSSSYKSTSSLRSGPNLVPSYNLNHPLHHL